MVLYAAAETVMDLCFLRAFHRYTIHFFCASAGIL